MATHRLLDKDERAECRERFLTLAARGYGWQDLTLACGEHGGFAKKGVEVDFKFYRLDSLQKLRSHMRSKKIEVDDGMSLLAQRPLTTDQLVELREQHYRRQGSPPPPSADDAIVRRGDGRLAETRADLRTDVERFKWREESQLPRAEKGARRQHERVLEGEDLEDALALIAFLRHEMSYTWSQLREPMGYANLSADAVKKAADTRRIAPLSLELLRDHVAHTFGGLADPIELGRSHLERLARRADRVSRATELGGEVKDEYVEANPGALADVGAVVVAEEREPTWEDHLDEYKQCLSSGRAGHDILGGAVEALRFAVERCPIPFVRKGLEAQLERTRAAEGRIDDIILELMGEVEA